MSKDENLPEATGFYSPALRIGDWIYVSGQGPIDGCGNIVEGDIESEVHLTLSNIRRLVEAAGGEIGSVVKCTCYLADIADFDAFDVIYQDFFKHAAIPPVRTTIAAALDGIKIEIDAVAYVGAEVPHVFR